ncbi:hypothetical protein IWX89_003448 [Cryobacterium sp. MP_M3]|uniref:hypothetical protein n=1 Tax=unclassified Cryobacterium TaxID=2649013 RepID=UPI0018CBD6C0|nr:MULTISPECIES: hypothetical protein [unclassified Cryobacterium]MBG6059975.1 hypothetical protein [Cryobacterium sp. MP_M3]
MNETASETGAISAVFIVVALLLILISSSNDIGKALTWAADAGRLLYSHLGWTLSIYITALLAFYAVSLGGQILGGPDEAARTRRVLGFVAELMAAATITLVAFIAVYCWQYPPMWPVLIILLPVVGLLLFLALQLGNFLVLDLETRIALTEKTQEQTKNRLEGVTERSQRSFFLVWALNSAVIAFGALWVTLPLSPLSSVLVMWLIYLVAVALLLGVNAMTMTTFLTSRDAQTRVVIWAFPTLTYAILVVAAIALLLGGNDSPLPQLGWAFILIITTTLTTSYWPRSHAPRWILDWSINGSAARLAERTLSKQHSKAAGEYRALTALRSVTPMPPSPLRRLRDAVFSQTRER